MEIILGVMAFMIAVLAILQGWQMKRQTSNNPANINGRLDNIVNVLSRMEQRLSDIWDKVNK